MTRPSNQPPADDPVVKAITEYKQLYLAKDEVYPHLKKLIDAMLEVRGVSLVAARTHSCDEKKLWSWVLSQLVEE